MFTEEQQFVDISAWSNSKILADYSNDEICPFGLFDHIHQTALDNILSLDLFECYTTTLREIEHLFDNSRLVHVRKVEESKLRNDLLKRVYDYIRHNECDYPETQEETWKLIQSYLSMILTIIHKKAVDLLIFQKCMKIDKTDELTTLRDGYYEYLIKHHYITSLINGEENVTFDHIDKSAKVKVSDFSPTRSIDQMEYENYKKRNKVGYEYDKTAVRKIAELMNPTKRIVVYSLIYGNNRAIDILVRSNLNKKYAIFYTCRGLKLMIDVKHTFDRRVYVGYYMNQKESIFPEEFYPLFINVFEHKYKMALSQYNKK